jgi:fructose-1,6-bisphosphatase/sedoheptulose 1,7-bisphosphatase-like protein
MKKNEKNKKIRSKIDSMEMKDILFFCVCTMNDGDLLEEIKEQRNLFSFVKNYLKKDNEK